MNVAKKKKVEMLGRRKGGTGMKTKKVLSQHLTINSWLASFVYPQFGYITCFSSYQRYIWQYNEWLTVVQCPWHLRLLPYVYKLMPSYVLHWQHFIVTLLLYLMSNSVKLFVAIQTWHWYTFTPVIHLWFISIWSHPTFWWVASKVWDGYYGIDIQGRGCSLQVQLVHSLSTSFLTRWRVQHFMHL